MSPIGDTYHRACLLECGDCPTSSVDIIEQSVLIALLPTLDPTTAREKEREGAESFPAFWFLPIEAMDPRPGAAGGGGRAVVVGTLSPQYGCIQNPQGGPPCSRLDPCQGPQRDVIDSHEKGDPLQSTNGHGAPAYQVIGIRNDLRA